MTKPAQPEPPADPAGDRSRPDPGAAGPVSPDGAHTHPDSAGALSEDGSPPDRSDDEYQPL